MKRIYPDYYKEFKCIADKCRHNCCIGWEIDIDPDTDAYYKAYTGGLCERLQKDICRKDDPAHFILSENERCPFLNKRNLCDIITEMGEEHLCTICAEHPRFHNELPDRVESGLGMCCEEAARIILTKQEPVKFVSEGDSDVTDDIIDLRDKAIEIAQNRTLSLKERCEALLNLTDYALPFTDIRIWAEVFLSLERLDEKWTDILTDLQNNPPTEETLKIFENFMQNRTSEYEQLMVYLLYRHTANAPDTFEASLRIAFSVLSVMMIFSIGTLLYINEKDFNTEAQIELCRMFSCEIEYSDENLYALYDELS